MLTIVLILGVVAAVTLPTWVLVGALRAYAQREQQLASCLHLFLASAGAYHDGQDEIGQVMLERAQREWAAYTRRQAQHDPRRPIKLGTPH
jgi:type II secretory pathway pseudopilin PulG